MSDNRRDNNEFSGWRHGQKRKRIDNDGGFENPRDVASSSSLSSAGFTAAVGQQPWPSEQCPTTTILVPEYDAESDSRGHHHHHLVGGSRRHHHRISSPWWNLLANKQHWDASTNVNDNDNGIKHGLAAATANTSETCQTAAIVPLANDDDDGDGGGGGSFADPAIGGHGLPDIILETYQYYSKLDYAFIHAMAYVFGNNVCHSGSYFRLKMALMLGLVAVGGGGDGGRSSSSEENLKNNCSLLVINDDDLIIDRLFRWSCSLARNHFIHFSHLHTLAGNAVAAAAAIPDCHHQSESLSTTTNNNSHSLSSSSKGSKVAAVRLNSQSGEDGGKTETAEYPNVGTLNLAANGIFVMGVNGLQSLSVKERAYLEHALESNEIVVAGDPLSNNGTAIANGTKNEKTTTQLLKAVIWAQIPAASSYKVSETKSKSNFGDSLFKQPTALPSSSSSAPNPNAHWIDLFANVWMVKESGLLYLSDFDGAVITAEQWRRYIDICRQIDPMMTGPAEDIVKLYFVMNRQIRPGGHFPIRSISVIFSMARSIAKLNLRRYVARPDAILAVLLYEEQLLARYPEEQSGIGFSFADFTHISDRQHHHHQNGGQRFANQPEISASLSALLDDSYMGAFEEALMKLFHHHQSHN